MKKERYRVGHFATKMLEGVVVPEKDKKGITFVKVTPEDLEIPFGEAAGRTIITAAQKRDLKLCPKWVAAEYRLRCPDDEHVIVGVEPVTFLGIPLVFNINYYANWHMWLRNGYLALYDNHPRWLQGGWACFGSYSNQPFLFCNQN